MHEATKPVLPQVRDWPRGMNLDWLIRTLTGSSWAMDSHYLMGNYSGLARLIGSVNRSEMRRLRRFHLKTGYRSQRRKHSYSDCLMAMRRPIPMEMLIHSLKDSNSGRLRDWRWVIVNRSHSLKTMATQKHCWKVNCWDSETLTKTNLGSQKCCYSATR